MDIVSGIHRPTDQKHRKVPCDRSKIKYNSRFHSVLETSEQEYGSPKKRDLCHETKIIGWQERAQDKLVC